MAGKTSTWQSCALSAVALCVAILAVLPFCEATEYGLADCDDHYYLKEHEEVSGGLSREGLRWAFTSMDEGVWMPLTWITYMVDGSLGGSARIRHAHSLLYHALNAALVFLLLFKCKMENAKCKADGETGNGELACAALAALLWAVHPLRVESVVWLASRKDVVSLFWLLLATMAWERFRALGKKRFYAAAFACFAMSLAAKPSAMSFPVLLLALDVYVFRRVSLAALAPFACLAAVGGALAAVAQSAGGATDALGDSSLWWRLVNAATSVGVYLWHSAWPQDLAVQCMARWPAWPRFMLPGVSICAVAAGFVGWRLWRDRARLADIGKNAWGEVRLEGNPDGVLAGIVWFLAAVAPMLGILNFGYHAYADRFTYLPAVGLSLAIAFAMASERPNVKCKMKNVKWRMGSGVCGIAVAAGAMAWIVALGCASRMQTRHWRDDRAMWERTLAVDGEDNLVARRGLALWHFDNGHDLGSCLMHFNAVFGRRPELLEQCLDWYMIALCEAGRKDKADELMSYCVARNDEVIRREQTKAMARGEMLGADKCEWFVYARVAWFLSQPGMIKAAEEELEPLARLHPDAKQVRYLKCKMQNGECRIESAAL